MLPIGNKLSRTIKTKPKQNRNKNFVHLFSISLLFLSVFQVRDGGRTRLNADLTPCSTVFISFLPTYMDNTKTKQKQEFRPFIFNIFIVFVCISSAGWGKDEAKCGPDAVLCRLHFFPTFATSPKLKYFCSNPATFPGLRP